MPARALLPIALAAALVGCSDSKAPTREQNRALDNAADLLDEAPANLNQIDDAEPGNASAEPGEER